MSLTFPCEKVIFRGCPIFTFFVETVRDKKNISPQIRLHFSFSVHHAFTCKIPLRGAIIGKYLLPEPISAGPNLEISSPYQWEAVVSFSPAALKKITFSQGKVVSKNLFVYYVLGCKWLHTILWPDSKDSSLVIMTFQQ